MKISKKAKSFNEYDLLLSYGELIAVERALAQNHSGPVADELYAGIRYFLDRLPRPGEDEDETKGEKEDETEELDTIRFFSDDDAGKEGEEEEAVKSKGPAGIPQADILNAGKPGPRDVPEIDDLLPSP